MSIIKAYALPHPPLAVPDIGKGREIEISDTLKALSEVAKEIAAIAPETIIYITPHSTVYSDYFHISPGKTGYGDFERFGSPKVRIETEYDEEMVRKISQIAEATGIPAGTEGERDKKIDHGMLVPMYYINEQYNEYKSIRIAQSGMSKAEHYIMGQIISKASDSLNRRVVVIGSSDLSHRLTADGPYGFASEGEQFDKAVTDAIKGADILSLLKIPENIREGAGECGYNSLMVIAGILNNTKFESKLYSYEGPFGVGYAVAGFSIIGSDEKVNFLEEYLDDAEKQILSQRKMEDSYQELARLSLEHIIRTGEKLPIPNGLPEELTSNKAGVFVSLHIDGRLRGCIGTIVPTTDNIAQEIIQNAISAGLSDSRFPQVSDDELKYITYKVDVLKTPEPISSSSELDVKRYGVIVTSGMKRGLLLPNLDGVDTIEDQIDIASRKAGISKNEKIELQRFEVIRHG